MNSKQNEILTYIKHKIKNDGQSPSVREIAEAVNLKSTSSVQHHINNLIEKGLLDKRNRQSRSISSTEPLSSLNFIPIIGQISAGTPLLAEENRIGEIPYPEEKYNKEIQLGELKDIEYDESKKELEEQNVRLASIINKLEKNLRTTKAVCEKNIKLKEEASKEDIIIALVTKDGGVSKMKVNNQVASNPIGYYEGAKNFADLPCRLTHFTRTNFEKYNEGLKFIQRIDKLFQRLIPEAHHRQLERADTKPHLKIPKTSFSTITINRNFRTALHRDANDFKQGFGNLTVIERGKYQGGYTVFPQFGVGLNLRNNDFVVIAVPSNSFNQEKSTNQEVKEFCEFNFNITFPITEITEVKGENAHPIYKWAAENHGSSAKPKWNFHKLLINKEGKIEDTFSSITNPTSTRLTKKIEQLINN